MELKRMLKSLLIILSLLYLVTGCVNLNKAFFFHENFSETQLEKDVKVCKQRSGTKMMRGSGPDSPSMSLASGNYYNCLKSMGYVVISCPAEAESANDAECIKR